MDKVIFVSSDSHAGMPRELWAEYLDPAFHDLLPSLRHDNTMYPIAVHFLGAQMGDTGGLDEVREAHASGYGGLHDAQLRLEAMDLDGVAAELIFHGDGRLGDLFHNGTNRTYPLEAWQAGAEAWNRWAADNFAIAPERFLVVAALGPCTDIDVAVADVHRNADRGFVGTYGPGYVRPRAWRRCGTRTGIRSGPRAPSATFPWSSTPATAGSRASPSPTSSRSTSTRSKRSAPTTPRSS